MSFWNTSDNQTIEAISEFEAGGNIEPIPNNTDVLAAPDQAGWDRHNDSDLISVRWNILQPKEYEGRKIFQRIRVMDDDDKKADKAKRMLAAIDTNAGGKLLASGEEPTDESLARCLVNKPMVLKLMVWEMEGDDGQPRSGNWVSAVSPRKAGKKAAKAAPKPEPEPVVDDGYDDDIGF